MLSSAVPMLLTLISLSLGGLSPVMAVSTEQQQSPAGISDLLAATPTMLSPLNPRANANTMNLGNTITISGSKIVFARSDKPTLVETIKSMIENSEPSAVGDEQLTNTILAVLEADGSGKETTVTQQIHATLECRAHKEKLLSCVEKLVDAVVSGDQAAQEESTPGA